MKNIVLIGVSGSGKTAMGGKLAQQLSREFIDLDSLIQEREGLNIPQIFQDRGEEGFRQAETEAIAALENKGDAVIACGGGAVLKEINMEMLSQKGILVFLNRPVRDILESVDLDSRPLLRETPEKLYNLYRHRLPLYERYADFEVSCEEGPDAIIQQLTHISSLEGSEKKLAVIGDPIGHSLSPDIHISAIRPFLKSLSYERERVEKGGLSQWIALVRESRLDGFNVTMPHKEDIIPLLDGVDKEAAEMGSVNTVVNRNGELWGYSTDGDGFAGALASIGESFAKTSVTIIGSGGAAATIAMKAAKEGAAEIHLVARNQAAAESISQKTEEVHGIKCNLHPFDLSENRDGPWSSRFIINSTPMGMKGVKEGFPGFDFLNRAKEGAVICDLIYSPAKTEFLIEAEKRGLRALGGIMMLIEQALKADCLYIGAEIKREKTRKRVLDKLKGKVEGI